MSNRVKPKEARRARGESKKIGFTDGLLSRSLNARQGQVAYGSMIIHAVGMPSAPGSELNSTYPN